MKSLGIMLGIFFSISVGAAKENMCERILNDILKTSGLGQSFKDFNSTYLKSSTQNLAEAMPEYKKIMEEMEAKRLQVKKWREEGQAENALYQQAIQLPAGKSTLNPLDMLELLSEEIFKKDPSWRGLYVIDKTGPIAEALLETRKMSTFYDQQCGGVEAVKEPCVSMLSTLGGLKSKLFSKLKSTVAESDKIVKGLEKKSKPHLDRLTQLASQIESAEQVYSALRFDKFLMVLQNPEFSQFEQSVRQDGGGEFTGMKVTTLTTKIANNYDKSRIRILEEDRNSLLTQKGGVDAIKRNMPKRIPIDTSPTRIEQVLAARAAMQDLSQTQEVRDAARKIDDEFKAELKADSSHLQVDGIRNLIGLRLNDTKTELSLLSESPLIQVVTRNGVMTGFVIGPPVNFGTQENCSKLNLSVERLKPELLSKNQAIQSLVFAAYGVKNIDEYKAKLAANEPPGNFNKYSQWIDSDNKERAPRRVRGLTTSDIQAAPAGR